MPDESILYNLTLFSCGIVGEHEHPNPKYIENQEEVVRASCILLCFSVDECLLMFRGAYNNSRKMKKKNQRYDSH